MLLHHREKFLAHRLDISLRTPKSIPVIEILEKEIS